MPDTSLSPNEKAVHALKSYGNAILRVSFVYLHNMADAEDILQDTLIRLMRSNPDFTDQDHEKAWLLRVAINLCKNRRKSAWSKRAEIPENYPGESLAAEECILLETVIKLPAPYRDVIHLFYYEGYSTAGIAGILQKNESTVRSLLHRARKMLKKELKEGYDFDG
ncbi:MAG TPA: RNA polymerase subunit sigma-70 [Clostridiales bacterium]|nr:RNA polymerase subunit sigma-70 [Clostridiales bacterium]